MNKAEESIVKPPVFKHFSQESVLFIPVDSPDGIIAHAVSEMSLRDRPLPMGRLFLLPDRTVLYGCVGAPAAALALESLVAGGAKRILLLGFCGALCRRARLWDALIVREALADEGTSPHYFPDREEFHPAPPFTITAEDIVFRRGLPLLSSAVVSTDAPYRETPSWRRRYLERGVDAVDMETSAVFALAEFHGIQAASLLIVSDELSDREHRSGFGHSEMDEIVSTYFLPFLQANLAGVASSKREEGEGNEA
jgi:nucleoside phosphorylase